MSGEVAKPEPNERAQHLLRTLIQRYIEPLAKDIAWGAFSRRELS